MSKFDYIEDLEVRATAEQMFKDSDTWLGAPTYLQGKALEAIRNRPAPSNLPDVRYILDSLLKQQASK